MDATLVKNEGSLGAILDHHIIRVLRQLCGSKVQVGALGDDLGFISVQEENVAAFDPTKKF